MSQLVGELRPSQLLHTYGVGAIVDLPFLSVMVMGLDDWQPDACRPIVEERLLAQVRRRLGPFVERLLAPPVIDEDGGNSGPPVVTAPLNGVPVAPFPRWLRCPSCGVLAPVQAEYVKLVTVPNRPDLAKFQHSNCPKVTMGRPPAMLPARFMLACEDGHLDDFPWEWFVHHGNPSCMAQLQLYEMGVSGEAADVWVKCLGNCGQSRPMSDAFGRDAAALHLPACRGRLPHLRSFADSACRKEPRTILIGASNHWFGVTLSTLHVPGNETDPLDKRLEDHLDLFAPVKALSHLELMRSRGELGAFSDVSDEQIWARLEARNAGPAPGDAANGDIKTPEWLVFSNPGHAPQSPDFELTEVATPQGWDRRIERVVLAERLREVTALLGFTRIRSPRDFSDDEVIQGSVQLARRHLPFVPATEVRGEGIFIQLREDTLQEWLVRHQDLEATFIASHASWRRNRALENPMAGFPGLRYVLVHSLSHALMRQLALECGYASASLRERIYAREADDEHPAMAGVLIYTSAPDSEGTLGGLVRMGHPAELGRHLAGALCAMEPCSADPLCAEHIPDPAGTALHGACCHACLFAPETSCERGNRYLDRTVLVDTIRRAEAGWFGRAMA